MFDFFEAVLRNIVNTWFLEKETKIITYESGEGRSITVQTLYRQENVGNDTVDIETVYVGMQHKIVTGELILEELVDYGNKDKTKNGDLEIE